VAEGVAVEVPKTECIYHLQRQHKYLVLLLVVVLVLVRMSVWRKNRQPLSSKSTPPQVTSYRR
jgi:hypothetical protein